MEKQFPINRLFVLVMVILHILAITGLFLLVTSFTWSHLILAVLVWAPSTLCITLCFHRLLAHPSYKTYRWVKYVLSTIGCVALQGDVLLWVARHRIHHAHTDDPAEDPHTPRVSGYWAHLDWMIHPDPRFMDRKQLREHARDIYKHAYYRWLERFFWVPLTVVGILALTFGGWRAVSDVALAVVFGLHATWLVNSATHMWGSRRFATGHNANNDSRNNWWVAMLTWGEGWHNNHHALAGSARHGFEWYEIDVTWYVIRLLKSLGLVWKVKVAQWDDKLQNWVLVELK